MYSIPEFLNINKDKNAAPVYRRLSSHIVTLVWMTKEQGQNFYIVHRGQASGPLKTANSFG